MSRFLQIRNLMGLTQVEMAEALGCSPPNVSFLDRGQTITPATARRLIDAAAVIGLALTFEHLYGTEPLPARPKSTQPATLTTLDWRAVLADLAERGWSLMQLSARLGVRVNTLREMASGELPDPTYAVGCAVQELHRSGARAPAQRSAPCSA